MKNSLNLLRSLLRSFLAFQSLYIAAAFISAALAWNNNCYAHEGHDHAQAPGSDSSQGVTQKATLTDSAIHNLGIKTVKAVIAPQATTIDLNAIVEFLPDLHAEISSPTNGKVLKIESIIGEKVKKDQPLLSIKPILVGSSPVVISAPLDGYITKQNVVIGQSVTPEATIMEIADSSRVLVRGSMYETKDLYKVKVGQKVRIWSDLIDDEIFSGTLTSLDGAFDHESRTFNVYAIVENPNGKLLANMQTILSVEISEPSEVLTVPAKAILGETGEQFVFVKTGNDFERRSVKLGNKFGSDREILTGVFPDEEVVVVGSYQLQFANQASEHHASDNESEEDHDH